MRKKNLYPHFADEQMVTHSRLPAKCKYPKSVGSHGSFSRAGGSKRCCEDLRTGSYQTPEPDSTTFWKAENWSLEVSSLEVS